MSTVENVCVYGNDGWVEMGTKSCGLWWSFTSGVPLQRPSDRDRTPEAFSRLSPYPVTSSRGAVVLGNFVVRILKVLLFFFFQVSFLVLGLVLGLGLGLGLWLRIGFKLSWPIVRELVLRLTRLSYPSVRFRHNPQLAIFMLLQFTVHVTHLDKSCHRYSSHIQNNKHSVFFHRKHNRYPGSRARHLGMGIPLKMERRD